jgi:hypothetical protein
LKIFLILIVICLGGWKIFLKNSPVVESNKNIISTEFSNSAAMQALVKAKALAKPQVVYKCDGRQHCSQMNSYEEAKYFTRYCPDTKMDGDNDGIPCEAQFNK